MTLVWLPPITGITPTSYRVFRDGTVAGQTALPGYIAIGLTPATTYTFTVKAYDAQGNGSPSSNAVVVKTSSSVLLNIGLP